MRLDKLEKLLGKDTIKDLESMPEDVLKGTIVISETVMKETKEELEANDKYQELRDSLKLLRSGLSEVNKRHRGIIQYCLHLLESKGK